ncbi:formate dehydrogenase subunit delta [Endozoicomonadaceae bacterium StTr2]
MPESRDRVQQLIKKANQVAINQPVQFVGEESAVNAVAEHLEKFWDPHNRQLITNYLDEGGKELNPIAEKAVARLA